jgi:mRNA-degrading endonuclease RelE of RelBE toxin-antitoxin system
MSYALVFTTEANEGLRQLEPPLQEIVLDIVDDVALRPMAAQRRSVRGVGVHDFECDFGGVRYSVFVVLQVNHARHEISVLRIGHASDPVDHG